MVLHEARSSFRTGFFVARCFAPVADDETRIRVCTHSINREWCAMVSQDKPLWLVILSFYRVGCYAFGISCSGRTPPRTVDAHERTAGANGNGP